MSSPELTLYHTNDMHGARTALEWLRGLERPSPSLLLDAGDAIRGSNTAFRLCEPNLEAMSRAGYHAMTMGNREFHYFRWVQRLRLKQRCFPLLAANLVDLRGASAGLWQRSVELVLGELKVGIMGATVVQYPMGSGWERLTGFRFLPPGECLPGLAAELRARCDLVIFLSHLGLDEDRRLAPLLKDVDLIVGGHTHTLLERPERVAGCLIVQAGSHGRFVGELKLRLGRQLEHEYRLWEAS